MKYNQMLELLEDAMGNALRDSGEPPTQENIELACDALKEIERTLRTHVEN